MAATSPADEPFHVPWVLHLLGGAIDWGIPAAVWLGQRESAVLAQELRAVSIHKPVFICGLARSGSTILHHLIGALSGVATHRMKDYPLLFTPFWWRCAMPRRASPPPGEGLGAKAAPSARERAHGDGILVSEESPEALEEMLWTAFFPRAHDPTRSNILGVHTRNPAFEAFYTQHIRKLLLAERAGRYAAKANYHVARLEYLLRIFPDARFVVPVRNPVTHVASLVRQQRRFARAHRRFPRLRAFMRRTRHFEFGLDRRPLHLGDDKAVRNVQDAWARGDEVRGHALHWAMVHAYLARLLETAPEVRAATIVIRHEDIAAHPQATLEAVAAHCSLSAADLTAKVNEIRSSRNEAAGLTTEDIAAIQRETLEISRYWGY